MQDFEIMQGDQYPLAFSIVADEEASPINNVGEIEVFIGGKRKTLSNGDIEYQETTGAFYVHLIQEETFAMSVGRHKVQVRIKTNDGTVVGEDVGNITVLASKSREVL